MAETHDQTYIAILTAALVRQNLNALVLAENGDNQLGNAWAAHPGWRIWNGNLCKVGHHDKDAFVLEVNAILPGHMHVDMAHHRHAHLNTDDTWVRCTRQADGAVPLTIAITQTRQETTP